MGFLVYVVTVRDLKLDTDAVKGYMLLSDHSWEQRLCPLPQVIYNRIPYREDEALPWVRRKIKECQRHPHIDLYNPHFFNKWRLFAWLNKSRLTKQWTPLTKRLKGYPTLYEMMKRKPYLYLKPEDGKAGQGIMRIRYQKNKSLPYRIQIQNNKNSTTYKAASLERLWSRVYQETKGSSYLIQQGIELAQVHGRSFDLRILVQKNDSGSWAVTGIGARMAGAKSITTHVPRGERLRTRRSCCRSYSVRNVPMPSWARLERQPCIWHGRLRNAPGRSMGRCPWTSESITKASFGSSRRIQDR